MNWATNFPPVYLEIRDNRELKVPSETAEYNLLKSKN